jgi:hypothetical protein
LLALVQAAPESRQFSISEKNRRIGGSLARTRDDARPNCARRSIRRFLDPAAFFWCKIAARE